MRDQPKTRLHHIDLEQGEWTEIDLAPHQWKSDRPKPREPFFGAGAPEFIVYVLGFSIMVTITYLLR